MNILIIQTLLALTFGLFTSIVTLAILTRVFGGRATLLKEDLPGWRSYVTFKPLPRFMDNALRPARPFESAMAFEVAERLRARGVKIGKVKTVGSAERVQMSYDGERWELTVGVFRRHPEQWLLTIDQKFSNGNSAPHDTAEARAMLALIRGVLEDMEISTIRWHARQNWNCGKIDAWAYKPF